MNETWLSEKSCRCCGTKVTPKNLVDKNAFGGSCPTCGHFNVLRQGSVHVPMRDFATPRRGVPLPDLPANGDHDASFQALGVLFRALLWHGRAIVRRERAGAAPGGGAGGDAAARATGGAGVSDQSPGQAVTKGTKMPTSGICRAFVLTGALGMAVTKVTKKDLALLAPT